MIVLSRVVAYIATSRLRTRRDEKKPTDSKISGLFNLDCLVAPNQRAVESDEVFRLRLVWPGDQTASNAVFKETACPIGCTLSELNLIVKYYFSPDVKSLRLGSDQWQTLPNLA